MSRKHYIRVAEILRDLAEQRAMKTEDGRDALYYVTYDLAEMFKQDNPNFDMDRFMDAVYATPAEK